MKKLLYKNSLVGIKKQKTFFATITVLITFLLTFIFSIQSYAAFNSGTLEKVMEEANIPQLKAYNDQMMTSGFDDYTNAIQNRYAQFYDNWSKTTGNKNNPQTNPLHVSVFGSSDFVNNSYSQLTNMQNNDSTSLFLLASLYNGKDHSDVKDNNRFYQWDQDQNKFTFLTSQETHDFNNSTPTNIIYQEVGNKLDINFSGETYISSGYANIEHLKVGDKVFCSASIADNPRIVINATLTIRKIADNFLTTYPSYTANNFFVGTSKPTLYLPINYSYFNIPAQYASKFGQTTMMWDHLYSWISFEKKIPWKEIDSMVDYANGIPSLRGFLTSSNSLGIYISTFLMKAFFQSYIILGSAFILILISFSFLIIYGILKRSIAGYKTQLAIFKSMGLTSFEISTSLTILPIISTLIGIGISIPIAYELQEQINQMYNKVFSYHFSVNINPWEIGLISWSSFLIVAFASFMISYIMCRKINFKDSLYEGSRSKPSMIVWGIKRIGGMFSINGMLTYNLFLKNFTKITFSLLTIIVSFICLLLSSIALSTMTNFLKEINNGINMRYSYTVKSGPLHDSPQPILLCEHNGNVVNECGYYTNKQTKKVTIGNTLTTEKISFYDSSSIQDATQKLMQMLLMNQEITDDILKDNNGDQKSNIEQVLNAQPNNKIYYLNNTSTNNTNLWMNLGTSVINAIKNSPNISQDNKLALQNSFPDIINTIKYTKDLQTFDYYFGVQILENNRDYDILKTTFQSVYIEGESQMQMSYLPIYRINNNYSAFTLYTPQIIDTFNNYEKNPVPNPTGGPLPVIPIYVNRSFLVNYQVNVGNTLKIPTKNNNWLYFKIIASMPNISSPVAVTNNYFSDLLSTYSLSNRLGWTDLIICSNDGLNSFGYSFSNPQSSSTQQYATYIDPDSKDIFAYSEKASIFNVNNILLILILIIGIIGFFLALFSLTTVINIMIFQDIRYLSVMHILGYKWNYSLKQIFVIYTIITSLFVGGTIYAIYQPLKDFLINFQNNNPLKFAINLGPIEVLVAVAALIIIFIIIWCITMSSLKRINPLKIVNTD
ncbi:hypothetical protein ASO20_02525 [Mycoplasma sp. (ex Biomphalaria glabrata)]|uniref:FtsX-like permease family protein n=1 Tax=Mycoplasma sp. (ex Biomphalaria glabrata) TaxID=1749074 RepID=UPI00073AC986|nr:FtsX-like permease family protein [Mycoplasma sp. (ex Biomphalaria glabrata)]ALV23510.1 hypothetical protein ASO20_02525 [Mycoplasma sp. (ex Biomphalaria glabrata)]